MGGGGGCVSGRQDFRFGLSLGSFLVLRGLGCFRVVLEVEKLK